jgi:hypothetical protein
VRLPGRPVATGVGSVEAPRSAAERPGVRIAREPRRGVPPFGVAGGGAAGEAPIFRIEAATYQPPLWRPVLFPRSCDAGGASSVTSAQRWPRAQPSQAAKGVRSRPAGTTHSF